MKFSEEIAEKILVALRQRLPDQKLSRCAICGTAAWVFHRGYVRLTVQEDLVATVLGGKAFPLIALICTNCGNTHLLNLGVLGLADLVKPDTEAETTEPE